MDMYEKRNQKLLSRAEFRTRVIRHMVVVFCGILVALSIGVIGYHLLAPMPWIDALLNASMILGGMGPVDILTRTGAKLFASFYALFSGVFFIGVSGLMLAPFAHRFIHRFHLDEKK
jgi:hypothetical protein